MNLPFHVNLFDGILSLLGAVCLIPAIWRLCISESPTPLEKNLRNILMSMSFLFVVRFPYFALDLQFFGPITYLASLYLSVTLLLYFETLMRKHWPLWFKIYASVGVLIFTILALFGKLHGTSNRSQLFAFGFFLISCELIVFALVLLRNRSEHTKIENAIINSNLISLAFIVPFFLTDITTYGVRGAPRIGVIGGLLFAYLSIYNQTLKSYSVRILKTFARSVALTAALTVTNCILAQNNFDEFFISRNIVLFFSLSLGISIFLAVRQLDMKSDLSQFLSALADSDKSSSNKFLVSLRDFFQKVDRKILAEDDLKDYNVEQIQRFFKDQSRPSFNVYQLKDFLSANPGLAQDSAEAIDQLIELLEIHEMTHICELSEKRKLYALLHIPMVGYNQLTELKANLVVQVNRLIEK